jgi:hypothetical protein
MFTPRRFGALAGVAFVALFIAGAGLEGSQPKLSATAAKITSYYTSHHSKTLIAISGLALLVWVLLTSALMLMPRPVATVGGARATVPDGP